MHLHAAHLHPPVLITVVSSCMRVHLRLRYLVQLRDALEWAQKGTDSLVDAKRSVEDDLSELQVLVVCSIRARQSVPWSTEEGGVSI
jgi:hypothetical protein